MGIFSCEHPQKDPGGFYYIEHEGTIDPVVLKHYPKEIDSIIADTLLSIYRENYNKELRVSHPAVSKKKNGHWVDKLDKEQYDIMVKVHAKSKVEFWYANFDKKLRLRIFHNYKDQ